MKKLLVIGGIIVAIVVVILFGTKRALDPTRTALPAIGTSVSSVFPELDSLKRLDRQLVIGYLLLRDNNITTLPTQGLSFTAETFQQAIAAQEAILAEKQVSPEWPLMRVLEEQALQPLRTAVSLELVARKRTTMNDIFKQYRGANTVASGGSPFEPRVVMIYRIRNNGRAGIRHLTGYIQPQRVSNDWIGSQAQGSIACKVDVNNIAPGGSTLMICAQIELNDLGDASQTPGSAMFINWRPDMVEYSNGSKLVYDANALNDTLLWGRYDIDGNIRAAAQ